MATVTRSVVVDAPATEAWARLADIRKIEAYRADVRKASLVGETKDGVGAKRRCELEEGAYVEEVVEWQENRALTLRMTGSEGAPWKRLTTAFRVEPVDERSVVAVTVDFATAGLGFGRKKAVGRDLEAFLAALKADAEGRPLPEAGPATRTRRKPAKAAGEQKARTGKVREGGRAAKAERKDAKAGKQADRQAAKAERKDAKAGQKADDAAEGKAGRKAAKAERKGARKNARQEKQAAKADAKRTKAAEDAEDAENGADGGPDDGKPLVTMTRKEKAAAEEKVRETGS